MLSLKKYYFKPEKIVLSAGYDGYANEKSESSTLRFCNALVFIAAPGAATRGRSRGPRGRALNLVVVQARKLQFF